MRRNTPGSCKAAAIGLVALSRSHSLGRGCAAALAGYSTASAAATLSSRDGDRWLALRSAASCSPSLITTSSGSSHASGPSPTSSHASSNNLRALQARLKRSEHWVLSTQGDRDHAPCLP